MFAVRPQQPSATWRDLQDPRKRERFTTPQTVDVSKIVDIPGVEVRLTYDMHRGWSGSWLHKAGVMNSLPWFSLADDVGRNGISANDAVERLRQWTITEMRRRPHLKQFERD